MRVPGGMKAIEAAIEKLSKRHEKHIKAYDPNEGKVSKICSLFSVALFSVIQDEGYLSIPKILGIKLNVSLKNQESTCCLLIVQCSCYTFLKNEENEVFN